MSFGQPKRVLGILFALKMFFCSDLTFDQWKNAGQSIVGMCFTLLQSAKMLACDGIRYISCSVILLRNLISTTVRLLRVLSALVVHTRKYEYVNSMDLLHSMRPCL